MPNGDVRRRVSRAARRVTFQRLLAKGYTPETARSIMRQRRPAPNLNRKPNSGPPDIPDVPFGSSHGDRPKQGRRLLKRRRPQSPVGPRRLRNPRNNPDNPGNSKKPPKRSGSCSGGCGD